MRKIITLIILSIVAFSGYAQTPIPAHAGSISDKDGGALLDDPRSVVVSGNYAYVVSRVSNSLEIIDISNSIAPVHVGSISDGEGGALLDGARSVYVSGNYAYVASEDSNAVEIVDISNPVVPVHAGSISNGEGGAKLSYPQSVYVSGNYAYVASYSSNAVEIVDISNPVAPVHAGSISNGEGGAKLLSPISVVVSGNYAYVASSTSDALEIIDISNPVAPVHAGSISDGQGGALLNAPRSVYVSGNYAYVASFTSNALEIVDISNPAAPVHAGSISDGQGGALMENPRSVVVSGNYAYVLSFTSQALEIVDISNPLVPVHVGSIPNGQGGAKLSWPSSVYVSGNYAYVASSNNALEIVDISNPITPVHAGSISDKEGGAQLYNPESVYVSGNYAYGVSRNSDALEIVDISNPIAPVHAGSISNGEGGAQLGWPKSVYVSGNYAYVASWNSNALEIVDISNPDDPVHAGSISHLEGGALLDGASSVFVSGNYAYVASSNSDALEIVDISNPVAPVHAGSISNGTLLNGAWSVYVLGNYAYVASNYGKVLEIVDISNPVAPVHAGSISNGTGGALLDGPVSVYVSGNYAYVASFNSNALEVVDVSDPVTPVHAGSISNGEGGAFLNRAWSVHVSGNYAYVASEDSDALEMVDISNPVAPVHSGSISNGTGGALLDAPKSVYVSGNYAYVASYSSNALEIVAIFEPITPVAISASSITGTSFIANCDYVLNATSGYFLDVSTDNFSTFVSGYENLAGAQSISVTGLSPVTTYQYRFRAANPNGTSSYSNVITVGTRPGAPVATEATNIDKYSFTANWEAVTGVDSYYIEVSVNENFSTYVSGFAGTVAIDAANTSESITGLTAGTLYYYRVTAEIASTKSLSSNVISQLTVTENPVALPATNVTQSSFVANWGAVTGADNYYLKVSTNEDLTTPITGYDGSVAINGSQTSESLTGLLSGTTYYYQVTASNTGGILAVSNVISQLTYPANPVAVSATEIASESFVANWETVTGADNYYLEVSINSDVSSPIAGYNGTVAISGASTSETVTGLLSGTTYYYRVTAENTTGKSSPSNITSLTTLLADLMALPATNVTQSSFVANWGAVTGVDNYYLKVSINEDLTTPIAGYDGTVAIDGTQTSETITELMAGTTYYYQVTASNSGGTLVGSNVISQLTYPADPVAISASDIALESFMANWEAVISADSYYLEVSINNNFSSTITGYDGSVSIDAANTSETVNGLSSGTTYYYRVTSENSTGKSSPSNIMPLITLLSSPVATNASGIGENSFVANWELVTGADEYELEVSLDDFTNFLEGYNPKTVNTTQEFIEGLIPERTYKYRVRAKNAEGVSTNSNAIEVTTFAANSTNQLALENVGYSSTQDNVTTQKLNISVSGGVTPYIVEIRYKGLQEENTTNQTLTATSLGEYSFDITPSLFDELGVEFEIVVTDVISSEVSQYGVINLSFNETQSPTLPFEKFGGTDISWNLFTMPYDLVDKSVSSIFANYDPARHEFDWKIVRYRNNSNDYVNFNTGQVKLGEAYWFNAKEDLPIKVGAGQTTNQIPFPLSLAQGWNLIGNPYTVSISWNKVLVDNASTTGVGNLQIFNGSQQATGDVMAPFSGGFVWSDAATTVQINPLTSKSGGRIDSGGRIESSGRKIESEDIDEAEWMISLNLMNNNIEQQLGGFGMHPEASEIKDKYDDMAVPRFVVYNDLYTRHEDYFYPKFATDVVPTKTVHTWSFTLASNSTEGYSELVWDQQALQAKSSNLYLLDKSNGIVVDMKAQGSYSINLTQRDFNFEVHFVGDGELFIPKDLIMGDAYPNPARTHAIIPVVVPGGTENSEMDLTIYDINGRHVSTLAKGEYAPGAYKFTWDIADEQPNILNGMFFYRLVFTNNSFAPIQKKIIIKR